MAIFEKGQVSLRGHGHSEARAAGALLGGAAAFVAVSLILPHPIGANTGALLATAGVMAAGGILCFLFSARVPLAATHAIIATTTAATGLLIYESGVSVGQYGSIFIWTGLICGYYFPRRVALAHLGWILLVYATALAAVESTAGYSPLTRWLFAAISLAVVTLTVNVLASHRARSDMRARRFFELSHDMLDTSDRDGRFIELNEAWTEHLGYTLEELRAIPFIDLVHPDDRERTEAEGANLFNGAASIGFENRYRAKDGSWHWLRWSAQLSADESVIYGRATDITELKRVEAEREELLEEVRWLAHSDPLTGLPNRRTLDAQMPREMARARRNETSLCLAIIDIDHFKKYNDTHGHLAGDEMLRRSAIAWDSTLRGEDTIVRFGGEEFLVLLPDCSLEKGAEVIERLRAAMPDGQSCSAGLACWDSREPSEDLIGRADYALYKAKEEGRNRLVAVPPFE